MLTNLMTLMLGLFSLPFMNYDSDVAPYKEQPPYCLSIRDTLEVNSCWFYACYSVKEKNGGMAPFYYVTFNKADQDAEHLEEVGYKFFELSSVFGNPTLFCDSAVVDTSEYFYHLGNGFMSVGPKYCSSKRRKGFKIVTYEYKEKIKFLEVVINEDNLENLMKEYGLFYRPNHKGVALLLVRD